jgi:hypothetical protein
MAWLKRYRLTDRELSYIFKLVEVEIIGGR